MLRPGSRAVPLIEYGARGQRKRLKRNPFEQRNLHGSYYNDAFNPE